MALSKEQILAAQDLPREEVAVPEWGGTVFVRMLTAAERDAWEVSNIRLEEGGKATPNLDNRSARLVALCAVDEEGNRLFSLEEAEQLGAKAARAVARLYAAAERLNGLRPGQVEDLAKN